ncbi:MAG: aldehyde-activating protein [Alphaproteobacteria bacterium]|nr:aldehyde-activating protein [Alphaproteobacteria bacterium]
MTFETNLDPANMEPRACQCSFCRMHSTAAVSDPDGHLTFTAVDPKQLNRYTFGLNSTEFLICRTCGVYVGAFMPDGDQAFANVMAGILGERDRITRTPVRVERERENLQDRRTRRRAMWTPATLGQTLS